MRWVTLTLQVAAGGAGLTSAWYWFRGSRLLPRPGFGRRAAVWAGVAVGLAALSAVSGALA